MTHPFGRLHWLRMVLAQAYQMRLAAEAARAKPSKRTPLGDAETGPAAAAKYRARHPHGGLRQFQRAARIEAGLRPLKFDVPGKRERAVARKLAKIEARAR